MHRILTLFLFAIASLSAFIASAETITVSTNNTPQDRKALEAISREAFGRIGH